MWFVFDANWTYPVYFGPFSSVDGQSPPFLSAYAKWSMLSEKQGVDTMDKLFWTKWGCEHVIRAKLHRPFKVV
jgi:hypothetical protein